MDIQLFTNELLGVKADASHIEWTNGRGDSVKVIGDRDEQVEWLRAVADLLNMAVEARDPGPEHEFDLNWPGGYCKTHASWNCPYVRPVPFNAHTADLLGQGHGVPSERSPEDYMLGACILRGCLLSPSDGHTHEELGDIPAECKPTMLRARQVYGLEEG